MIYSIFQFFKLLAADLQRLIASGIPGNLHDQAWDIADELVRAMR